MFLSVLGICCCGLVVIGIWFWYKGGSLPVRDGILEARMGSRSSSEESGILSGGMCVARE